MKKELTTGSMENNFRVKYWFLNKMGLWDERILHSCKSNSLSKLYVGKEISKTIDEKDILQGSLTLVDFFKLFEVKGKAHAMIKKSVENLRYQKITIEDSNKETFTIPIFSKIEYKIKNEKWNNNKSYIDYWFDAKYLNFIWGNVIKNFHVTSAIELKRFKRLWTPKLLRCFKSNISLGIKNLIIPIEYSYLRKMLLGEVEETKIYLERMVFNRAVIKKTIDDINGYSPPSEKIQKNRNTFISVKLIYQDYSEEKQDYIYGFKVSSSKVTLKSIDEAARLKGVSTATALANYSSKKINIIESNETKQKIIQEKHNTSSKTSNKINIDKEEQDKKEFNIKW